MKFEYGRLSEKRNEEIENMQIINPFGELWVPRLSFKGIRVVKSEDEYYVFKHLIGGPNFTMHIRMKHIIYLYAKINIILLHSVMKIILEKL